MRLGRARVPTTDLGEVATVTQRLSVLLAAGLTPASAWRHTAETAGSALASRLADTADGDIPRALADGAVALPEVQARAWRGLAAAWSVAVGSGAPLAPCLMGYARSLRDLAQAQREAKVALAAPVATARLVMVLPVVGILFGLVLGFDTVGILFGSIPGWACLILGATLMLVAVRWNRRLVRAAEPKEPSPGLGCELMAIAVAGGGSLDRGRVAVEQAVSRFAVSSPVGVDALLELSRSAGVPAATLLRAEAEEQRRDARATAQEQAAALSVRLMLPLGLCVLPAFMVLGVFPLVVAVITSTVSSL